MMKNKSPMGAPEAEVPEEITENLFQLNIKLIFTLNAGPDLYMWGPRGNYSVGPKNFVIEQEFEYYDSILFLLTFYIIVINT